MEMQIEEDTSAQCYECGLNIWPAVPCATREQYFANGGRSRTPYKRIKYFREWMNNILGYPVYVDDVDMRRIRENLREKTPMGLKKTLKKLKLQKYNKGISHLLSEITGERIPVVSEDIMCRAEWMFDRLEGKISYYPDAIYKIFHEIDPNHAVLRWIPRK